VTDTRRRDVLLTMAVLLLEPLVTVAQETRRVRRVAVLIGYAENDPEAQLRLIAFKEGLATLGWVDDRNVRFDVRWGAADPKRASVHAKELVALRPDVILIRRPRPQRSSTKPKPFQSCSLSSPTQSAVVLSNLFHNRAGISRDSSTMNQRWPRSGSNCLSKSRHR